MWRILFLMFLPCILSAQSSMQYTVKGDVALLQPIEKVYLSYYSYKDERSIQDSADVKNGKFELKGPLVEPSLAHLKVVYKTTEKPKFGNISFFLAPGLTTIKAKDSISNHEVVSDAHKQFASLDLMEKKTEEHANRMVDEWLQFQKQGDKEKEKISFNALEKFSYDNKEKIYGTFFKQNKRSPVAVFALREYAGSKIDSDLIDPLFNSLPKDMQAWPSAKELKERIEIAKKTRIGDYAMDFTQPDTSGKLVSLSSFKGKYVLVEFWASWCGPCLGENPNLGRLHNKYKDKNFTILGVSLDKEGQKDKWLAAIRKDSLNWTQVSDLKKWNSQVAKLYGIKAIHFNLLLDPQGRIIAKDVRGEELDIKLEEILGNGSSVKSAGQTLLKK